MRISSFTLFVGTLVLLSSCVQNDATKTNVDSTASVSHNSHEPQAASSRPKDGLYPGKGKITKINKELGTVELDHEEIVGVMPAMIMEFNVSDKWLLTGLRVGDDVEFLLNYKQPSETIVSIKKVK